MIRRALKAEAFATPVVSVPVVPLAPAAPVVPGLAEAKAAVAEAQERELDRALDVRRAEQDAYEAEARKQKLEAAVDRGEDVDPAAIEAEDEEIRRAVARIAMKQDAVRRAEDATKAAEARVRDAVQQELRRRAARAFAASETTRLRAEAEYAAGRAECNRLAELGRSLTERSRDPKAGIGALNADLAASAEFASSARGDLG